MLRELIELFVADTPKLLRQLDAGCAAREIKATRIAAHTLKGSLRYLGNELAATELAAEIEAAMSDDAQQTPDWPLIDTRRRALHPELDAILATLQTYLAGEPQP